MISSVHTFTLAQGLARVLSLPSHPWTCALLFERSLLPCSFLLPAQLHLPPLPASHHDGQGLHELEPPVPLRNREHCQPGQLHARHRL